MTFTSAIALFGTMLILAIIPGPSMLVVTANGLSKGYRSGFITTLGVLTGDYIFILLSVLSITAIAEFSAHGLIWVKFLGAGYLVWLGINLILKKNKVTNELIEATASSSLSLFGDYLSGMFITLGNPKAILFYLSFFPALLDLQSITIKELTLIFIIVTIALGGVLLAYLWLIIKAQAAVSENRTNHIAQMVSGGLLICGGLWIALKQ